MSIWTQLRNGIPGKRFRDLWWEHHGRRPGALRRILSATAGGFLVVAGALLLFTPGPGALLLVIGGAILAIQSLGVASALDRLELCLRAALRRLARH